MQLHEDLLHMRLDRPLGHEKTSGDRAVREPFGDQSEHLALARGEFRQWIIAAPACDEAGDYRRVDDRLSVADSPERVDQDGDVEDALFEEVADSLGMLLEEADRVRRLDVVRENEHADVGMLGADPLRGDEALVRVGRRHADVDDRSVRSLCPNLPHEGGSVFGLSDDVDACLLEEAHDPLTGEHRVLGDDYAHGISARRPRGVAATVPPRAPTRSARWIVGATPRPSASTMSVSP